jgi:hypothetical protein
MQQLSNAQASILETYKNRLEELTEFVNELPDEATSQTVLNGLFFVELMNPFDVPEYQETKSSGDYGHEINSYQTIFDNIHNYAQDRAEINPSELQKRLRNLSKRINSGN